MARTLFISHLALTDQKTINLSKIAHEFKNPIICVSELVNRIQSKVHSERESDKELDLPEIAVKMPRDEAETNVVQDDW